MKDEAFSNDEELNFGTVELTYLSDEWGCGGGRGISVESMTKQDHKLDFNLL